MVSIAVRDYRHTYIFIHCKLTCRYAFYAFLSLIIIFLAVINDGDTLSKLIFSCD